MAAPVIPVFRFQENENRSLVQEVRLPSSRLTPSAPILEEDPQDVHSMTGRSISFANLRGTQSRVNNSCSRRHKSRRYRSEILRESFSRNGKYAKRAIREAILSEDMSCSRLKWVLGQLEIGESGLCDLVRVGRLSEAESVQLLARITKLASVSDATCDRILNDWKLGPILFTTPELGKWSTFGGLGVMVDDLINTMAPLMHSESANPSLWVCSPYYERNRKGEIGYLARDNVCWSFNIEIDIGMDWVTVGVYEGVINGIRHFFLHNATYFPSIYPAFEPMMQTAFIALMARCPLEICCHLGQVPSTVVTNDWATGLTAAYAKTGFFGSFFNTTKFMHIAHNLDQNYEGRIYPHNQDLGLVHQLRTDLLVDPHWQKYCVNPSRCAILTSDNWGTVSLTYRKELMEESPLAPLLRRHPFPFAHPNGIPVESRLVRMKSTGFSSHAEAKSALQEKYFGGCGQAARPATVLLAYLGRITYQKGIHLILEISDDLLRIHSDKVQILIAGAANRGEEYAGHCAARMQQLRAKYPKNFWSDPDSFFVDGPLLNLGADFGLMPSAFEPGGIVQQEFMVAGTPVIAFKTGGLKDTISEFYLGKGNGFTFQAHAGFDLAHAIERALKLFWTDPSGYELLRKNAKESVVSCDMVARAWLKELYRMHNKVYVDLSEVENAVKRLQSPALIEDVDTEAESAMTVTSEESEIEVFSPTSSLVSIPRSASLTTVSLKRSIRICFEPKYSHQVPRNVLLAGSFDHWASRIPLKWDISQGVFLVDLRVPQGRWQVKLIVDGAWICIDEYPMERDLHGNVNNVILVD